MLLETAAEERRLPPRRLEYAAAAAASFRKQYQREQQLERGEGVPAWGDAWAVGKFQYGR